MAKVSFSIKDALTYGYKTFIKNWKFLVIVFAIVYVAGLLPSLMVKWSSTNYTPLIALLSILLFVFQLILGIGVIVISLKIIDHKKPELSDLVYHYSVLLPYFLGALLYVAVIVVGIVLLIVPGIIWGIKYQYTTYLIIDKKMTPLEAFKKSGKITEGNKWNLFLLGLSFAAIYLMGEILFHVGLVLALPIISLAGVHVYRKLSSS